MTDRYFVQQGSIYAPGWHVYENVRDDYRRSRGCFDTRAEAEDLLAYLVEADNE